MPARRFPPPWSVGAAFVRETQRGCRDFFFLLSPFSQTNFSKKTFLPGGIHPGRERLMIPSRLPVLGAIALIVVMILNCGVAVAGPNQTSADYVMPGCRDAASLISFSIYPQPRITGLLSRINASSSFRVEFKLSFSVMHWPVASTENNRPSVLYSGIVIPLEPTCCFSRSQSSLRPFQVRNDEGGLGGIINP